MNLYLEPSFKKEIEEEAKNMFSYGDTIRCRRLLDYDLSYTKFTLNTFSMHWRKVAKTGEVYLSYGGYCVWINGVFAENLSKKHKQQIYYSII
jgi:hypothetical protein